MADSGIELIALCREHLLPTTGLKDPELLKARLIGQERSGGVLFSWNVPGDTGAEEEKGRGGEVKSKGATCVGWYVFNTNSFITLYR